MEDGKFLYKLLNCEIFDTLFEVKVLIERWRREYNTSRLYSFMVLFICTRDSRYRLEYKKGF